MIFTFALFDRALDIIGLGSLIYWAVKGTVKFTNWRNQRRSAR